MLSIASRAGFVAIWIFVAAMIAVFLGPALWPGEGGRDFRPVGIVLASILFFSAAVFRAKLRWPMESLLGGLGIIELFTMLGITYFSGVGLWDSINLHWFIGLNVGIGLPWILGLLVGAVAGRKKSEEARY